MKARRTVRSTTVFRLPGGTEDNDLWVEPVADEGGHPILSSTWEPTEDERLAIAKGANVELLVWGEGTPPVALRTTDVQLGKAPEAETA
jgi:hypothetical protein